MVILLSNNRKWIHWEFLFAGDNNLCDTEQMGKGEGLWEQKSQWLDKPYHHFFFFSTSCSLEAFGKYVLFCFLNNCEDFINIEWDFICDDNRNARMLDISLDYS